jgi:hypothetical protein
LNMAGGALLILMWLAGAGGVAEPMAVREYSACGYQKTLFTLSL